MKKGAETTSSTKATRWGGGGVGVLTNTELLDRILNQHLIIAEKW